MDRFLLACLIITAALCALGIVALAIAPQLSGKEDPAVRITLADPDIKTAIANHDSYEVVSVTHQGQVSMSGFINVSDTIAVVNMSMKGRMFGPDRYISFVDLDKSKVVSSEWYSYRGFPGFMDITLPPGASYYHLLYGPINGGQSPVDSFGVQTFWCHLSKLSPENALLYPILVDESNLSRMKKGTSYEPVTYNDTGTSQPAVLDGSHAVYPGWSVNASVKRAHVFDTGNWPDFDFSRRYYIVFKNPGPDSVRMTIDM